MLAITSIEYTILAGCRSIAFIIIWQLNLPNCNDALLRSYLWVVLTVTDVIYAYNFYLYVVTGIQFRADLRSMLCSCRCPNVNAANDKKAAAVTVAACRHVDTRV